MQHIAMNNLAIITAGLVLLVSTQSCRASEACQSCHADMSKGLASSHQLAARACTGCHAGDAAATELPAAHAGLIAFPGNLGNAQQTCGGCHPAQVASVTAGPMHTGTHMVQVTRRVFGEETAASDDHTLQALTHSPADSLLRKLCASCHLGQDKRAHRLDVTRDRGGGCLACHLNEHPDGAHPQLTAKVEDGRCFGCHSRSSRIALAYAGLAEVEAASTSTTRRARLDDGRLVEYRPADVHHQAGLGCIDCHTGSGLMGSLPAARRQDQSVDIACSDCHDNRHPRIRQSTWPAQHRGMLGRIPSPATADQEFLTTANGTPLWHIEVRAESLVLHSKLTGQQRTIPPYQDDAHTLEAEHARLDCNACHAQWAPQCYGCHLSYSPEQMQWDHIERKVTPGQWSQRQSGIRNNLPPLGVTATGAITPFVPGMIMTIDHPNIEVPSFQRLFGSLAPHTTGPARSCNSCHTDPVALGLGEGRLEQRTGQWHFKPAHPPLADGLPADAWTTLEATQPGSGSYPGDRSFNQQELIHILNSVPAQP